MRATVFFTTHGTTLDVIEEAVEATLRELTPAAPEGAWAYVLDLRPGAMTAANTALYWEAEVTARYTPEPP